MDHRQMMHLEKNRACQIFLVATYQNEKKYTKVGA
jgi:hypothetical protein